MSDPRVVFATCAAQPGLDPDDALAADVLAARGVAVTAAPWDDPHTDWSAADLVVVRSTWDYPLRRDAFTAWAGAVPRLVNPGPVVAWNTDKRYLDDLARAGVPVVETHWREPGDPSALPAAGDWVVKPAVSAGSRDTGRFRLDDAGERARAEALVGRLGAAGRTVMLQPYLEGVDTAGETALVHLDGRFSHAVRKGPMLDGPDSDVEGLYRVERLVARTPDPAERALADAVLAALPHACPAAADPSYARVDVVPGPDGAPVLLELELTEPSLFLGHAEGAPARFADAVVARL